VVALLLGGRNGKASMDNHAVRCGCVRRDPLLGICGRPAGFGDLTTQGSISFRSGGLTRAMLDASGNWEVLSCSTAFLIADIGSSQTPSYDSGAIIRFSGVMEGLGYLSAAVGIGTTPFGQVMAGSCFEGARILISDLTFCGGKAGLDLSFGKVGLQSEVMSWQTLLPFHDFKLQVSLRFADLLEFQGLNVSIRGSIGDLQISGYFSSDADYVFAFGGWSLGGPLFGGNLSSGASFNSDSLSSLTMTWTCSDDGFFLVLGPEIEIESFDGRVLQFGTPSVRADIRWTLGCCDGPEIGDLGVFFVVAKATIEQLRITYTYAF
jgi:hypothetical protein